MEPRWVFLIGILGLPATAWGQTCVHTNLSKSLIFTTNVRRIKTGINCDCLDFCAITIAILNKRRHIKQTVHYTATHLYENEYRDCTSTWRYRPRSAVTPVQATQELLSRGSDYLIVGDFNFDGREDFAALNDSSEEGAPTYKFYLQQPTGKFSISRSLTEDVRYFPDQFSSRFHTLTISVPADTNSVRQTNFKLNNLTKEWRAIDSSLAGH